MKNFIRSFPEDQRFAILELFPKDGKVSDLELLSDPEIFNFWKQLATVDLPAFDSLKGEILNFNLARVSDECLRNSIHARLFSANSRIRKYKNPLSSLAENQKILFSESLHSLQKSLNSLLQGTPLEEKKKATVSRLHS